MSADPLLTDAMTESNLESIFRPRSVVLIGDTSAPGSLGRAVLENLRASSYEGSVHRVDESRRKNKTRGIFPNLEDLPEVPDAAVIVTRASEVPDAVTDCGERGIPGAIVLSSGFGEIGPRGAALERKVLRRARRYGLRFLGPNCPGVMRSSSGLNASTNPVQPLPGRLALVSQSCALCSAILDWASDRKVGFSSVISTGTCADINLGEILDYLVRDHETDSILLFIEGIRDARRFMSALRAAARIKPVVVMKAGRHMRDSHLPSSHTGALVGSEDVFDAALRRAGVLRVRDFADFVSAAATLDAGVRATGDGLAIITNATGPGTLAADHAADRQLVLPTFGESAVKQLSALVPGKQAPGNPLDLGADADAERYAAAAAVCLSDPSVHALLAILTPGVSNDPDAVAQRLLEAMSGQRKPLFTCWMGGSAVESGRRRFIAENVPTYATPEGAVAAFAGLARYDANQQQLLQVPEPLGRASTPDIEGAQLVINAALAEGHEWLNPAESKAVLSAFEIPIVTSMPAHTAMEAATIAREIGFPVAMKVLSPDITHKTEVGGVILDLPSVSSVRDAYLSMLEEVRTKCPEAKVDGVLVEAMHRAFRGRELMIGVVRDEVFGPVISFGLGGTLVEVIADRAVALPPLNRFLARDLIERTRAGEALLPLRGAPAADRRAVEDILLRISEMACELPNIEEMDLNPVVATDAGAVVVDARFRVSRANPSARPYSHMAIHPYPSGLVRRVDLSDGRPIIVRPIRPEDAVIEKAFVDGLSDQTKFLRFMNAVNELSPAMLSRFTQIDYDREMALIAVIDTPDGEQQIGVARYTAMLDGGTCEFAIVVGDDWQGKGLARQLLTQLVDAARESGFKTMMGVTLHENGRMIEFSRSLGFDTETDPDDPDLVRMTLAL